MRPVPVEAVLADVSVDLRLARAGTELRPVLESALSGRELSVADAVRCLQADGDDLLALIRVADEVRRIDVGNEVTYVVNRNINFTNICFVACRFCAFKRHRLDGDAYNHSVESILTKVREAVEMGATEICMQGGINPEMPPFAHRDILGAIKRAFPSLHMHAFSPMEIMYGARRTGMNHRDYLAMLKEHGLDTIPGTAAEILDDGVRDILSHKKVDVATWVEIITTAHALGIPSTSTLLYGHVETATHVATHLALLRTLQRRTGGFTEFVPLRFIHHNTDLQRAGIVTNPPPRGMHDLRMYACSRLMLRGWIDNIQTSWVKLNHRLAQLSLHAGCNDFGGTLMEESISREAGADAGEYTPAHELQRLIAEMGRHPVERTTLYRKREGEHHRREVTSGTDSTGGRSGSREISARPHPYC